jgi:nuclear pore complex protein Nup88
VATDDGNVRCAEVRQCLLMKPEESEAAGFTTSGMHDIPVRITTYRPSISMDITITVFEVNKLGTHAVLAGPTLSDPELSAIYIMDFTSRSTETWTDGDGADDSSSNIWVAQTISLDSYKFETHPGLVVRQATWHPESNQHVAVLTSDCTFRLYNIRIPDIPEQLFELNISKGRVGIALDEGNESEVRALVDDKFLPVSFSFGVGDVWDRFAVYFLFAGGDTGVICPVAPFGARYPSNTIDALKETCTVDVNTTDMHVALTREWIDLAFQPVFQPSGEKKADDTTSRKSIYEIYECVPHILEEHCPMLVWPLSVLSNQGHTQQGPSELNLKEGLLIWRVAGALTLMAIASVNGVVDVCVLLDEAKPLWVPSPPQCIVIEKRLHSTRSQVVVNDFNRQLSLGLLSPRLLLIDKLDLRSESEGQLDGIDVPGQTAGSQRVSLSVNRATRDELYLIFPRLGVYVAALPWVSILTTLTLASHSGDECSVPDLLPAPGLRQVLGFGESVASAVTVGDALCGNALVVLTCDGVGKLYGDSSLQSGRSVAGDLHAKRIAKEQVNDELTFIEEDINKRVERVYGSILKVPKFGDAQESTKMLKGGALLTSATIKLLADEVAKLRFGPIEHAHHAHHDLAERLNQLGVELEEQLRRIEQATEQVHRVKERQLQLHSELERRQWVMKNVSRRAQLLAELYWALPRPASIAEVAFQKEELPSLEDAAAKLEREISSLSGRAAALLSMKPKNQQDISRISSDATSSVTPQQLGRWREVLLEHDRAIREVKDKLHEMKSLVAVAASSSVE